MCIRDRADAGGATTSRVDLIEGEARTREIARMLGGERISETTLAHALEMLQAPAGKPTPARSRAGKARA